ncbi:hypothetical protein YQE_06852, partial [Dendroctonus ponderosae]
MDFLRTMVKAKKFILSRHFVGFPQPGDLQLIEEELRPLKDGEFLAQALYLSVDPYMRKYANTIPLQSTMVGTQVAKIVDSKNDKFPVGQFVAAPFGWRTFTISNGEPAARRVPVLLLPDMGDLPLSLAIGVLGMPGNSAYFGFLEILHPQAGETIAISGAAGAVGSHVGQIAKIKGLKVIGIAGSDEKGRFLTKDLGFDHFINYKTEDISQTLQEIAPEGVDLYFDNTISWIEMVVAKKYVLVKHSEGFPKPTDFKLVEEQLPPLKEDEYLTEAVFLSVDPYMRAYMRQDKTEYKHHYDWFPDSQNSGKQKPEMYVVGQYGWRSHTVASENGPQELGLQTFLLPDFQELPVSLGLGVLGMPGNTAYFGLLELCQPKAGETVVISRAAGAVGSFVGQIAKIKGCTAIGIAGSDEKGKRLTNELEFDHFINYKTQNVEEELKKAAPKGVDLSTPNASIVLQQLKLEGFIVSRWNNRWMEGIHQNLQWIKQGKLKYRETVTEGFENMFKAFTE